MANASIFLAPMACGATLLLALSLSACDPATGRAAAPPAQAASADAMRDTIIVTEASTELLLDELLAQSNVDVDAHAGHVVLLGTASDPQARERATAVVRTVRGVVSVDNRMTVRAHG